MGFRRVKRYELQFGSEELEGLKVVMDTASIDTFLRIRTLLLSKVSVDSLEELDAHFLEGVELVRSHVLEWNLEDADGNPVGTDVDSVRAHVDRELLAEILSVWKRALEGIPVPLPRPSPATERSAEESIPMESLSESP